MSSAGLIEAYWKTERAKHHLDELKAAIAEFSTSHAYSVSTEDDIEKQIHRIRVRFNEPHCWIHLIAGDLFYCLRSALDHAVFRLAKDRVPYPQGTQFPIFEIDNSRTRRRFADYTVGIAPEAVEVIKSLQPYLTPKTEPMSAHMLWMLDKMCNIDKHRRIPIRGCITDFRLWGFRIDGITHSETENGAEITIPLAHKPEVALKPDVSVDIVFGDSSEGVEIGIDGIEAIYDFVSANVLPRLSRFCK